MGCKESRDTNVPLLLCFFETGNGPQCEYCSKIRDNFKHVKTINYQIKSEQDMKFAIKFQIKDKIYDIQTEFNDSEEEMNKTLNKMYELLG